jgi:hypothetical protein
MLLVKCSQCGASYKLSEELYRRKAAGFGVVVTCRRCKTEIHVDADPPTTTDEQAESDAAPTAPTHERPEPPAADEAKTASPPVARTPDPAPVTPKAPATATPLATKPAVPRLPGAPPRPAAATVKGLGVDAVRAAAQSAAEAKATSPQAPKFQPPARTAPKLVALSPGLLGTVTAPKPKPPSPPSPATKAASPSPPAVTSPSPPAAAPPPVAPVRPAAAKPPARDPEEAAWDPSVPPPPGPEPTAPDSEIPVASQDFLPADSAPSSEMSVDSKDFMSDSASTEASTANKEPEPPRRRLPEAPAPKRGAKPEPKPEELPSTTGTPKLDTLIHGAAVPLEQKKGEPRKRLPSGDLSEDFMSADLGFDAPALSPPNTDALTRAPVSSRPAAAAPAPSKEPGKSSDGKGVTKSARPVTVKAEKRSGSGKAWVALLLLAGLGIGGFAFRDRLRSGAPPAPATTAAAEPPRSEPTPEPPVSEPVAPAAPAPTEASSVEAPGAAETPAAPGPATATSPPASPGSPASPGAAPRAAAPSTAAPGPVAATPASTAPAPARPTAAPAPSPAAPAPAPTAIEPRPPVGTEPFDAAAARAALDASAAQASSCRKPGDPSGVAVVVITFSPTGRVTTATINGPPFAATPTGGCIASTLRKTRVPAFAGDMVTVRKTVTIH